MTKKTTCPNCWANDIVLVQDECGPPFYEVCRVCGLSKDLWDEWSKMQKQADALRLDLASSNRLIKTANRKIRLLLNRLSKRKSGVE